LSGKMKRYSSMPAVRWIGRRPATASKVLSGAEKTRFTPYCSAIARATGLSVPSKMR